MTKVTRGLLLACAVLGCGGRERSGPEKPKPREPVPAFAQRPLKIEVEGTSEKRKPFDVTFVGMHVLGTGAQVDMQVVADALARYLKLTLTPVPPPVIASQCHTLAPDCMAPIGGSVGAKHLMWGTLEIRRGSFKTSLFVIDVAGNRVERQWTETLGIDQLRHEDAQALMDRGRLAVLGADQSTMLVESEVDGTLYVDGASRGKLAVPHTRIPLGAGKHRVRIESRGYASTEREIDVPTSHFVRVVVRK